MAVVVVGAAEVLGVVDLVAVVLEEEAALAVAAVDLVAAGVVVEAVVAGVVAAGAAVSAAVASAISATLRPISLTALSSGPAETVR